MWTHLIWDFNGTIYDDMEAGFDSINYLLDSRGLPSLASLDDYRAHFGFPIEKYYRELGFDVDGEGFDVLAHDWLEEYLRRSRTAGLRDGVLPVMRELFRRGMPQLVLSASEINMLTRQLTALGIAGFFETILGLGDIYARSKVEVARRWRETHPQARPLFVGDTLHDAETAAEIGADCVLIAGGHQTKARLLDAGVPVVDSFAELLDLPDMIR